MAPEADRVQPANDASPLHRHRALICRRARRAADPGDIAAEINEIDPAANVIEDHIVCALNAWGFNRKPLPAGHAITWGAIVAGSVLEGEAYRH